MKRLLLIACIGLFGCSEPASKINNGGGGNNGTSNNGVSNNGGSNNGGSNNGGNNGGTSVLDPADYDASCEFDYDCEHVSGGDVCACPDVCPTAINADAAVQFFEDAEAIVCQGNNTIGCPAIACEPRIAVCSGGTCNSIQPIEVRAEDFDQFCETADDCVLIPTGPVCAACDCGRGAISASAYPEYEALVADVDCNPGPSPCDCQPIEAVDCVENTCVGGSF